MPDEETPAPTDAVDVTTRQETIPTLELPEYHGRAPVGMKTSLNGAGNRVTREHSIGDRVVLVIEAKVKKAGHEETDDGLIYAEVLKVTDLFEIQGDPGRRLISAVRQSYRTADDVAKGREPLKDGDEDFSVAGITDASGVALTPAELAELRGDPVRAMLDEAMTPVVIVYSDGARELWPDDFDGGAPRPEPGERFETADDGDVYVERILDAETGETVAEWTREQEEDRLLELEKRLEAEERAEEARAVPEDVDGDTIPQEGDEEPVDEFEVGDSDPGAPPIDGDLDELADEAFDDPLEEKRRAALEGAPLPGEEEGSNVVPIRTPAADLADELGEPTPDDYAFVDRGISEILEDLPEVSDPARLRRLAEAERRGRGRGLKTRKGALESIEAALADVLEAASRPAEPEQEF